MGRRTDWPFYSIHNDELFFLGKPLSKEFLDEVESVYQTFIVPETDDWHTLASFWFTIQNTQIRMERIRNFSTNVTKLSTNDLLDVEQLTLASSKPVGRQFTLFGEVNNIIRRNNLNQHEDLYSSAINFFIQQGGPAGVVAKYLDNPLSYRDIIVRDVAHVAHKLASMYYLTLGGDQPLLTIDRHVARQIKNFHVPIETKYVSGHYRSAGNGKRWVVETPSGNLYKRLEKETLNALTSLHGPVHDFLFASGTLHGGRATTLLWYPGYKFARGLSLQRNLSKETIQRIIAPPYGVGR